MSPFVLEVSLRSPIILGYRMMLDSLLIALGYERYRRESTVASDLPIQCVEGIPHASQMLIGVPDAPVVRPTTLIQSFLRVLTNEREITLMLARQPAPSSMSHGSGPNSNVESVYLTHNIPKVYFLGVGDVARIRNLAMTLVHIGSQAHKGYGEVEQVSVTELDIDPTWFGVVGRYEGQPVVLRPVPKRLVPTLPRGVYGFDSDETWRYPYFSGHPDAVVEPCLVPPFSDNFHRDEVRRLYSPISAATIRSG